TGSESLALTVPGMRGWLASEQCIHLLPNAADHRLPITIDIVEHHDPAAQALGDQSFMHYLQSGMLLADDQEAFLPANRVGHHVDDGLALARTGRPFDQQPRCLPGLEHRVLL